MHIRCENLSKRYQLGRFIIKDLNDEFSSPDVIGVSGSNGSGKSTFLRLISGYLSPSKGKITYTDRRGQGVVRNDIYKFVQFAAPYDGLIDYLKTEELFRYHFTFRSFYKNWDQERLRSVLNWTTFEGKYISDLSSGMQQRLRLLLAISSSCGMLILDEPTSFLDQEGKAWCYDLIKERISHNDTLMFIASNDRDDLQHITREVTF